MSLSQGDILFKVPNVAPEDCQKLTDADTLGESANEASWDDIEAVEDNDEARQSHAANHGKKLTRETLRIAKMTNNSGKKL